MAATILALALLALQSEPGEGAAAGNNVIVSVTGIKSDDGKIGCALFRSAQDFPMYNEKAVTRWQPARKGSVTCQFNDLPVGRYAVSVSHDLNGNRKTDTNFIGLPREDWGFRTTVDPRRAHPGSTRRRSMCNRGERREPRSGLAGERHGSSPVAVRPCSARHRGVGRDRPSLCRSACRRWDRPHSGGTTRRSAESARRSPCPAAWHQGGRSRLRLGATGCRCTAAVTAGTEVGLLPRRGRTRILEKALAGMMKQST